MKEMSSRTGHACVSKHHHLDTINIVLWCACREHSLLTALPSSASLAGHHLCLGLSESLYHLCVSAPLSLILPSCTLSCCISLCVCISLLLFLFFAQHLLSLCLSLVSLSLSLPWYFLPLLISVSLGLSAHLCWGPSLPSSMLYPVMLMETEILPTVWPLMSASPSVPHTHHDHFSSESPGQYKSPLLPLGRSWGLCVVQTPGGGKAHAWTHSALGEVPRLPFPMGKSVQGRSPKQGHPEAPQNMETTFIFHQPQGCCFFCIFLIVQIIGAHSRKFRQFEKW